MLITNLYDTGGSSAPSYGGGGDGSFKQSGGGMKKLGIKKEDYDSDMMADLLRDDVRFVCLNLFMSLCISWRVWACYLWYNASKWGTYQQMSFWVIWENMHRGQNFLNFQ